MSCFWGLGSKIRDLRFQVTVPRSGATGLQGLLDLRPLSGLFERVRIWGHSFLGTEALFVFFPAFLCLYLGLEALFIFFVRPWHFAVGRNC